ncbi:toxin-antitoxin system, toxin component [Streptomyces sp. NPDC088794]|uniref:toxin-antitoxin system, toxin component n=1 Tax=Streptomyces sp. NPDC088794 TaxID=3365902 RepID=UPI0037FE2EF8
MRKSVEKLQRRLITELTNAVTQAIAVPAQPKIIFETLCQAMSKRRGRPVLLILRGFPEELANTTTGLWLDLEDQDVIVIEEKLDPDHQLVVLGHEFWHMSAGHCGHDLDGTAVAARAALTEEVDWELARRVATRTHSHTEDELSAEGFGLLMGSRMKAWLAGPDTLQDLDDVARRISASLGYRGLQG